MNNNPVDIHSLNSAMRQLIDGYKVMEKLISGQIASIIKNDVEVVETLADQQIKAGAELSEKEAVFREELIAMFEAHAPNENRRQLSVLLPYVGNIPAGTETMRDELISVIQEAKKKQIQLLGLIEFAQQHTTDMLRAIHAMGNRNAKSYTHYGKTATHNTRSIAINQTA